MRPSRPSIVSFPSGSSQRSQKSQRAGRHAFNPLDDPRPMPFKFLKTHHLIITTAQSVYTCGSHGITEIFRSGSKGIVAARRASTGSGILAVADDHLVILHDVRKGLQSSYRLRSANDRVRMLRYAKASNCLFFTTFLQDAVQTYDLERSALLDPAYEHPSPPNAFAISSTSHLLLSTSESPPVIQLTNLLLGTRPLLLRPQCSSSSVIVVEFHPERGNLFLLAFADGTCAVYDAAFIFRDGGTGERRSGASASEFRWEVAHIKGLYTATATASGTKNNQPTIVADVNLALGWNRAAEITAAAFIPGYKTTVITAGLDGRCFLLDFAPSEARTANVLHSWSVAAHVTCLSLLAPSRDHGASLPLSGLRDYETHSPICYVAFGCRDSRVFIFDLNGNLLWDQVMLQGGSPILDIEWMEGDDWPQPIPSRNSRLEARMPKSDRSRKSPGSVLAGGRPVAEEIVTILDEVDAPAESRRIELRKQSNDRATDAVEQSSAAFNHLDLPALMKSVEPAHSDHKDSFGTTNTTSSESLATMMRNFQFPIPPIRDVPPIPPLERRSVGQLPRNNSWAAESPPNNQAIQKVLDASSIEAYVDHLGRNGGLAPLNSSANRKPPVRILPHLARRSSEPGPTGGGEAIGICEPTEGQQKRTLTDRPNINLEDLWTDITVDNGEAPVEQHDRESSNKENYSSNDFFPTPRSNDVVHPITAKPLNKRAQPGCAPGSAGFKIFVDKKDRTDHPQPLSANPSKSTAPKRQPLAPTSTNTSRISPTVRAPWYRQKARNASGENHRSSIYGPGALARKIQQEVMITVNVELDVLRREMNERFAFQKAEFEFEIKKSQVWTLRVDNENRKLREDLAKERKRREGERGRERLNLC